MRALVREIRDGLRQKGAVRQEAILYLIMMVGLLLVIVLAGWSLLASLLGW